MAQHDYNIANQTTAAFRTDLNNSLSAIVSNNSGASAPSTTFANQWWYDTTNDILKIRNEADTAWINIGYINQTSGEFEPYIAGTQITDFLDEDAMTSDSATAVASQQSIKAYVDSLITFTGSAPIFGVRAFCVWNGEGSTGTTTTQAEGNIGTLTKNSTGSWTVTFTTAMPDANYAISFSGGEGGSADNTIQTVYDVISRSTTGFNFQVCDPTGNDFRDRDKNSFIVVR